MDLKNDSNKILIFTILYLSLLVGFYYGENSSGGAYIDFLTRIHIIENFKDDFAGTFLNYDSYGDRHSPILIMILSYLNIIGINLDIIRFINLNILPLLILVSYKCLSLKYPNNDKNIIFFISCVFFLSPSLRSIAIWPDSRLIGLLFFFCSIYFFLKFKISHKYRYCIYSNLLLIFSSYISPNFSIFFLYFIIYYIKILNNYRKLTIIILANIILTLPILYYLFVLKVNFLTITAVSGASFTSSMNMSNKILIIGSFIFFYMIPFAINSYFIKTLIKNFKIRDFYISILIFFSFIIYFNYLPSYTGGGIFFKLSHFIFNNSYFFFIISFVSIVFILTIFKKNFNNLILFIILILSNPQLTIYHKYYDLLLILLFFLFFNLKVDVKKFYNYKFVVNIYSFYFIFLILNFAKQMI